MDDNFAIEYKSNISDEEDDEWNPSKSSLSSWSSEIGSDDSRIQDAFIRDNINENSGDPYDGRISFRTRARLPLHEYPITHFEGSSFFIKNKKLKIYFRTTPI